MVKETTKSSRKISAAKSSRAPQLIKQIKGDYPAFDFQIGVHDRWSPGSSTITFDPSQSKTQLEFSILHELAHALLEHQSYKSDFELVKLEAKAWQLAAELGRKYSVKISENHIQNCLDTYRDWLHGRSTCPVCGCLGLQIKPHTYECSNCANTWRVTTGHFARPYRRMAATKKHLAKT